MSDRITLIVRFRIAASNRQQFQASMDDIFTYIVKEPTFVEASLLQDAQDPEIVVNYEVWDETPESFMRDQLSKEYRAGFEKMIVDLKIDRTPSWYSTLATWKQAQ